MPRSSRRRASALPPTLLDEPRRRPSVPRLGARAPELLRQKGKSGPKWLITSRFRDTRVSPYGSVTVLPGPHTDRPAQVQQVSRRFELGVRIT